MSTLTVHLRDEAQQTRLDVVALAERLGADEATIRRDAVVVTVADDAARTRVVHGLQNDPLVAEVRSA